MNDREIRRIVKEELGSIGFPLTEQLGNLIARIAAKPDPFDLLMQCAGPDDAAFIHHVNDGRPPRRIYLNGEEVVNADYADTKRGLVIFPREPFQCRPGTDEVWLDYRTGVVTVVPIEEGKNGQGNHDANG